MGPCTRGERSRRGARPASAHVCARRLPHISSHAVHVLFTGCRSYVIGAPTDVEDNVYAAVWNHRVTVELTTQQSISACVWDDDGGLRGDDDLAGCADLSSDGIVEHIRTFRGTRMRPNWASVRPQITSGQHIEDFLIHVDRL